MNWLLAGLRYFSRSLREPPNEPVKMLHFLTIIDGNLLQKDPKKFLRFVAANFAKMFNILVGEFNSLPSIMAIELHLQ